jgi:septum formation protein
MYRRERAHLPMLSSTSFNPRSAHIILASASPRRRELLTEAGYDFKVVPANEDVECGVCSEAGPAGLVAELAYRKAMAVLQQLRGNARTNDDKRKPTFVLGADTVAELDGFILGKPRDEADAREMLRRLSGRDHRVLTGICLIPLSSRDGESGNSEDAAGPPALAPALHVTVTKLRMDPLSDAQLDEYVASGGWEGKAGAFGYQDRLGWVHIVEGSESNVVGLPMELLASTLASLVETSAPRAE